MIMENLAVIRMGVDVFVKSLATTSSASLGYLIMAFTSTSIKVKYSTFVKPFGM